jgi:hypothetical protein
MATQVTATGQQLTAEDPSSEATSTPSPEAAQETTPRSEAVYVVQVAEELLLRDVGEGESPSGEMVWRDIATVPVPPRTHRKRIIAKALNDAGITPDPNDTPPMVVSEVRDA